MSDVRVRETGHYWVKCKITGWYVAYWDDGYNEWLTWRLLEPVHDTHFEQIDERRIEREQ